MAGFKVFMALVVVLFSVATGAKRAAAQVHHVVGDDRGWEPSTDLDNWFTGRVFRVGDKLWFTYSAAQESIVELETIKEFLSCDLTNPVKMYTDGLSKVSLDSEGTRYFVSGNVESCRKGLKLPVKVQPLEKKDNPRIGLAAAPTGPSASTQLTGLSYTLFVGLVLFFVGL